MKVKSFDILNNSLDDLNALLPTADCVTLHIPSNKENKAFFDKKTITYEK